jgi:hypothetical protein
MIRPSWLRELIMGAVWGLMEGTWFFLVPDVLLSYIAIRSLRRALVASLGVVIGAMAAACVLYALLGLDQGRANTRFERFWSTLPGFRTSMMTRASDYLEADGPRGLLSGPQSGLPYRVFVVEAHRLSIPLSRILLWTPPARLERILLVPLIVAGFRVALFRITRASISAGQKSRADRLLVILLSMYWVGIYAWYWWFFLPRTYGAN